MNIELLKALVEMACSDGIVTNEELIHLRKKASEVGVAEDDLQFMIKAELERVKSLFSTTSSSSSGFTLDESVENENTSSGFITDTPSGEKTPASGFVSSSSSSSSLAGTSNSKAQNQVDLSGQFTEVTTLNRQGAMSLVQRAKYLGRWVIVKRIKTEYTHIDKYKQLFFKEFENAFHLEHPHIVRLYGKGVDAEGDYYFMEFIDGRPLSEMIGTTGIEDRKLVVKITTQLLDALSYVHKKQVFHRDLKPDNILITYKGDNVKIVDFGLSSADSFDDELVVVGTPKYAAPEQKGKGQQADQRSDIYAIGIILLQMLTGSTEPAHVSRITDERLRLIVHTSIEPDPMDRYQGCDEILTKLKETTVQTKTTPKWLEDKVRSFAADGVITRNERKVLEIDAHALNLDMKILQAVIDLELEKAKDEIARLKAQEKQQRTAQRQEEKVRLEREKSQSISREQAKKSLEQLKQQNSRANSTSPRKEKPKRLRRILIFVFVLFIIVSSYRSGGWIRGLYDKKIYPRITGKKVYVYRVNSPEGLNLRTGRSTNSEVITSFEYGTEVLVFDKDTSTWVKVRVDGIDGYMSLDYLTPEN